MGLSVALRPRNLRAETLLIRDWNGWWHQALVRNRRAVQAITTYKRPGGRVAIDVWRAMPRHVQLVGVARHIRSEPVFLPPSLDQILRRVVELQFFRIGPNLALLGQLGRRVEANL